MLSYCSLQFVPIDGPGLADGMFLRSYCRCPAVLFILVKPQDVRLLCASGVSMNEPRRDRYFGHSHTARCPSSRGRRPG